MITSIPIAIGIQIIQKLRIFLLLANKEKWKYCKCKTDFLKSKRLTFTYTILFILNMPRKTLSIELNDFYKVIDEPKKIIGKSR